MSVQMRIRAVEGQRPRTGSGRFTKKIFFRLIILNVIKIFFTKEKKLSDDS